MNRFAQIIIPGVLLIIVVAFQISCNKKDADSDKEKPIITVVEPIANDTLSLTAEPEIHIEITVTDNKGLHDLHVTLIQNQNDTLLYEHPSVSNLKVYSFHEHVVPIAIAAETPCKTIIKAMDHNGNIEEKIIQYFIKP